MRVSARSTRASFSLVAVLVVVAAGHSRPSYADALDDQRCPKPTEFESVFSFGYGGDQMPTDNAQFEQLLATIKAGGFNVIHTSFTDARFALCKQYGIKLMVDFLDPVNHHVYQNIPGCQAVTAKVQDDPGLWGYNIYNDNFGSYGSGRYRDIRNVRTWDPTHPAFCGTYRTNGIDNIYNADLIGFYDYHWTRGIDIHFQDQMAFSTRARSWNAWYYSWFETNPNGSAGENNYRKSLWSTNTAIACGQKGILWFLGTNLMNKTTFQWTSTGQDIKRVNQAIMPMQHELAKIGNPLAVYSTLVTKMPDNSALPGGQTSRMPPGLESNTFPAGFWAQPQIGEFVMGVYKDDQARNVLYVANHNAMVAQTAQLLLSNRVAVSIFDRADGQWEPLQVIAATVSVPLEAGGGEMLRMTPLGPNCTYTWNFARGGAWTAAYNWREGFTPDGAGSTADFSQQALTNDAMVVLNGNQTIGNLIFADTAAAHKWTIGPGSGGTLTLQTGSGTPTVTVNNQTATFTAALAGGQGLTKAGAGTLALTVANTFTGGVSATGGTLSLGHADAIPVPGGTTGQNLYVGNGAKVALNDGLTKAVQVRGLTIQGGATPTGTMDLKTGQLAVDGAVTPVATIAAQIAAGYNAGDPDNPWEGPGITSSSAAAAADHYAVGYAVNGDFGGLAYTTWFGRTVNANSVLVRCTYLGDADLSGDVTTDDFDNWKQGYVMHQTGWLHGDFDYSGSATTDDFDLWKQVYVKHYAPLGDGSGGGIVAATAVPEPGVAGLVVLGGLGLWVWWRRPSLTLRITIGPRMTGPYPTSSTTSRLGP